MTIRILAPTVAARIAAGEVVERPASVVKELVENALDAGATEITIEIAGGGARFLRVADNGVGIPGEEVALAFERHATSKLSSMEDLSTLSTLGFRGEALPSIAAVSSMTCHTRAVRESVGIWMRLEGGQITARRARARSPGTTMTVEELFRTVPARLAFLRSPAAETSATAHLITGLAMVYPEVRFRLLVEGRELLRTAGTGDPQETLRALYGASSAEALLSVAGSAAAWGSQISVRGFTSPVTLTRARRDHYRFTVNRRPLQSRLLTRAVDEAYRARLPSGRYPIVLLNLSMPAEAIDVNIHPAKAEVRFREEGLVFRAVQRALLEALQPLSAPEAEGSWPAWAPAGPSAALGGGAGFTDLAPAGGLASGQGSLLQEEHEGAPVTPVPSPVLRVLGQLANTYIVAEGPEGMFLIDQHTAHERLLYDRLRGSPTPEVQGLLEPVAFELTPVQQARLRLCGQDVAALGFLVEEFGERAHLLRGVPSPLAGRDPARAFCDFLDSVEESPGADWRERAAATVACHGATRAGDVLPMEAMRELVRQMEETALPRTCPHGRPTMLYFSANQLQREFGRR